jgi:hypothetical protein
VHDPVVAQLPGTVAHDVVAAGRVQEVGLAFEDADDVLG